MLLALLIMPPTKGDFFAALMPFLTIDPMGDFETAFFTFEIPPLTFDMIFPKKWGRISRANSASVTGATNMEAVAPVVLSEVNESEKEFGQPEH